MQFQVKNDYAVLVLETESSMEEIKDFKYLCIDADGEVNLFKGEVSCYNNESWESDIIETGEFIAWVEDFCPEYCSFAVFLVETIELFNC